MPNIIQLATPVGLTCLHAKQGSRTRAGAHLLQPRPCSYRDNWAAVENTLKSYEYLLPPDIKTRQIS